MARKKKINYIYMLEEEFNTKGDIWGATIPVIGGDAGMFGVDPNFINKDHALVIDPKLGYSRNEKKNNLTAGEYDLPLPPKRVSCETVTGPDIRFVSNMKINTNNSNVLDLRFNFIHSINCLPDKHEFQFKGLALAIMEMGGDPEVVAVIYNPNPQSGRPSLTQGLTLNMTEEYIRSHGILAQNAARAYNEALENFKHLRENHIDLGEPQIFVPGQALSAKIVKPALPEVKGQSGRPNHNL